MSRLPANAQDALESMSPNHMGSIDKAALYTLPAA
jgi:hypothetical protein